MNWDNIVPVLVGGALAVGGGMGTQWLAHHLDKQRKRRAIAGAFAGEIGAICSIVDRRKYLEDAQQLLKYMRESKEPHRILMHITQEYCMIYNTNSGAIGLLPAPLALGIATFYTQVKSLMEDVRPETPEVAGIDDAIARLSVQIDLLTETMRIGKDLVTQLQKEAK
ncbi:MAG: hypothetical protein JXL80_01675 [Planctomycetes bacterium]|nr:hypothetical protein [Planctomycetota bacterium]